jgi:hypothetical protein
VEKNKQDKSEPARLGAASREKTPKKGKHRLLSKPGDVPMSISKLLQSQNANTNRGRMEKQENPIEGQQKRSAIATRPARTEKT